MDLVSKLWGFCNKLRHDGVDSADYIEQLTYLLFLKMAEERGVAVPKSYNWNSLKHCENKQLLQHLEAVLQNLKNEKGILGDIFSEPVSRVRNIKVLRALIDEIDEICWSDFDADVVGIAFEELIGRVANEGKKGAGQYFTPRPLIQTIVNVMKPNPLESKDFKIGDVAVGTAGFLIVACEWSRKFLESKKIKVQTRKKIINSTYYGQELVQRPRRLALMNMFLHGFNARILLGDSVYENADPEMYDCILTNPPFGNKGANEVPDRNFPIKTSDKQINFIQHVIEKLKKGGRAAIVIPDTCLSSDTARKLWAFYLDKEKSKANVCNVHTILKLPEGVFAAYANGVKACVIFLQKGLSTEQLWIYDARSNVDKITTKSNALSIEHFKNFENSYGLFPNGTGKRRVNERFRCFSYREIVSKKFDLSFVEIIKPEPLPSPISIIDEMIADYERKISALKELKRKLPSNINESTETLEKTSA